jgi:hypothetical protein
MKAPTTAPEPPGRATPLAVEQRLLIPTEPARSSFVHASERRRLSASDAWSGRRPRAVADEALAPASLVETRARAPRSPTTEARPEPAADAPARGAASQAEAGAANARPSASPAPMDAGRTGSLLLANTGCAAETQTCSCFDVGARMRPGRRAALSEGDGSYALHLVEEHPRALAASQGASLRRGDPRRRAGAHHRRRERRRPDDRLAAARPPPSRRSARAAHRTRTRGTRANR